ncbi:MFS transporter [Acidovorax sp. NCPPB 2350]|nr:MFS transporter [Acidovorax sp. NCPPB 2350]
MPPPGMTAQRPAPGWLALLCATRTLQATVATAWAGVLPQVMADWQLSAARAGMVQGAWHAGYLVSLFAVGFIADRVGPRRVFLAGSLLTALAAFAFALGLRGPLSAALLFGLTGLCAGACYSPGLQLLAANAPPQARGRAMGAFIGAASLGYGLSLALVAATSHALPWRTVLLAIAGVCALGAVLTVPALRRMRPDPVACGARRPSVRSALGATLRDRKAMAGNWAYAAHCWELMALWAWLPAYLAVSAAQGGLSPAQGIALAALAHLVSVAGSLAGGSLSDRLGRTTVMMAASCASLACALGFGWIGGAPLWALALAGALYNLLAIADSSVYSTALADVVPPERLGAAYSVRSVMGFGAGAVSPMAFGLALDWGQGHAPAMAWGLAWSTVAAGALLGPGMILRLRRLTRGA